MNTDQKIDGLLKFMQEERNLNNSRFTQLSTSMIDLRKDISSIQSGMKTLSAELKEEIDKVYSALSEDIQVFAKDLGEVRRRADKIEKKTA